MTSTTTTADGVQIAYDVTGRGPALVLVHGITESRRAWDPLVADLAADHKVVALDVRGHGESGTASSYDPVTMADDVAAVVAAEDLDEPLVVGHSMGGIVATAYGAAHSCRGVVNIDQSLELAGFQELVRSAEPLLRGDGFESVITALFEGLHVGLPADEVARLDGLRRPVQEVVLGVWGPVIEQSSDDLDELVASLTANVRVPYLALHGSDPGPDYGGWLEAAIPSATLEVWDGSGHYPHLVHRERFIERVRAFDASLA